MSDDLFLSLDFGLIYEELNFTYNMSGFVPDPATLQCAHLTVSDAATVVLTVFYALVFAVALPGNLCVCAVLVRGRQPLPLQPLPPHPVSPRLLLPQPLPPSDLFLLHLALADLLLAATLPFWAVSLWRGWVFGDVLCKTVSTLQELSFYSSVLFLSVISVDRYLVIVRSVQTRRGRRALSRMACAAVWALGALLSLPALLSAASQTQGSVSVCREHYDPRSADMWRLATRTLRHALGFLLPLAMMLTCYGVTVRRLLQMRRGFQKHRAMRLLVCVVLGFLLCWSPYHVALMVDTLLRARLLLHDCGVRLSVDRAVLATHAMGLLHSAINPLLYAFVGQNFRSRCAQLMRHCGARTVTSRSSRSSVSEVTAN
ncbi:unnamed protein product [Knipowitschia caucasica]|uniref:G-protein coupled receptors family 1 profile domain-containing protein n=1 Tax=Knipowitschia caucasica TaxID=637954 RepID=A0AAV2JUB4_KNICA